MVVMTVTLKEFIGDGAESAVDPQMIGAAAELVDRGHQEPAAVLLAATPTSSPTPTAASQEGERCMRIQLIREDKHRVWCHCTFLD